MPRDGYSPGIGRRLSFRKSGGRTRSCDYGILCFGRPFGNECRLRAFRVLHKGGDECAVVMLQSASVSSANGHDSVGRSRRDSFGSCARYYLYHRRLCRRHRSFGLCGFPIRSCRNANAAAVASAPARLFLYD